MQVHWFSIVNSCVTVLLLTAFLATILMRVLKNDFVRFMRDEESGGQYCPAWCCTCTSLDTNPVEHKLEFASSIEQAMRLPERATAAIFS